MGGTFTVNGTVTTINSTTLTVDDKNIELGSVAEPTNATANGGGISLLGATPKTIIWDSTNDNWTSSENWNIPTGKVFKIDNASVLSSSALGAGVTGSSLTQVGTITSGTWQGTAIASTYVATLNQNTTGSAATVTTAAQPAITSVGTLTSLTVSGTLEAGLIDGGTF